EELVDLGGRKINVLVVGEFKKGKSALVNALLGARVCPVLADIATAVPTRVRYGREAGAAAVYPASADGNEARTVPIDVDTVDELAVEGAAALAAAPPQALDVTLPHQLLADGLVLID